MDLILREKICKFYSRNIHFCVAEILTLRNLDRNYLESFEMWFWKWMDKNIWTDRVRNEVIQRVKAERNIVYEIKWGKDNWIGHILRRNCLIKEAAEGKAEGNRTVTEEDNESVSSNCKLKEEALDRSLWRTGFGSGCGPDVKQTA